MYKSLTLLADLLRHVTEVLHIVEGEESHIPIHLAPPPFSLFADHVDDWTFVECQLVFILSSVGK